MAEIFNPPGNIKVPQLIFDGSFDSSKYDAECEKFVEDLKAWLKENHCDDENCGEIIRFPVADGHAEYMVASVSPVKLIHLAIGDAWNFQYAKNLTSKDVLDKIKQQKALAELFG